MTRRLAPWLLLTAACGRVGFDPLADSAPLGTFGMPQPIAELASPFNCDDAGISSDGLEIYFASPRGGTQDIYTATRSSLDARWSTPDLVASVSTPNEDEKSPELSADGLTLWYVARSYDIFYATRPTRGAPWSAGTLAIDGSALLFGTPAVCDNGRRIFVRGESPAPADVDGASRSSTADAWPTPAPIAELSSPARDSGLYATADCARVYFDSNRDGPDLIYVADLDRATGMYGMPVAVDGVEGRDPSLSGDQRVLVFTGMVNGVEQIFESRR